MNRGWEEALEVQAQLLGQINGPFWDTMVTAWLRNRDQTYGRHAMLPSAHAMDKAGEILTEADPIYVTSEMLDLTRSAMETFDWREDVQPDDFFLRSGFALLEDAFTAPDIQGLETAWRAVSWRYVELPPEASPDGVPVPSLEIILWWDTNDEDGWDLQHPEQIKFARDLYKRWGMRWAVMHATLCPLEYMSDLDHMGLDGDPAATWMTFIRVFNRLMGQKITLRTPMHPHRSFRRNAKRLGLTEPRDVIVVELRRPRERGLDWGEESGSRYSHQWVVHGGWQWRACGPGHSRRRQVFIEDYVKGPKDKPLVVKKRAWVWDR